MSASWDAVVASVFFMVGYSAMAIAAILRVQDRQERWQTIMSRPPGRESEITTAVMSLCVLLAVCLAALWGYQASSIEERAVYFAMGFTATFAMVARTACMSLETGVLRNDAGTDPGTGVGNLSAFEERLATRVVLTRRSQEPFVLVILNLDDFARVNEVFGRLVGDSVLVDVGEVLKTAVGKRCEVFRLSGDEFAVIAPGFGEHDRMPVGSDVLGAVSGLELGRGLTLSASVGVVSCDDGAHSDSDLFREADAAQVWAKYHGKDRVVVHDDRIVRALGAEERLRLSDARLHYDVARALAASADARDPRSFHHSRNVAALSALLGEAAGLQEESAENAGVRGDASRCRPDCAPRRARHGPPDACETPCSSGTCRARCATRRVGWG